MQRDFYSFILTLLLVGFVASCDTINSDSNDEITASEEKQFIWNGLNYWYYWQGDVPNLANSKKEDKASFSSFLNEFSTEEQLFNALKHQNDEFSWFISDYEIYEAARTGTSKSFGFRFQIIQLSDQSDILFGYVQYVVPGGPADNAGIERGDIFSKINGTQLTIPNYEQLLGGETFQIGFATLKGYELSDTGETVAIQAVNLTENLIHTTKILDVGTKKVGYLLYNAFRFNFHQELNDVFADFISEGIDELVLDLRYNGGGAVVTSAMLASMISGVDDEEAVFAELIYNDNKPSNDYAFRFYKDLIVYKNNGEVVSDDTPVNQLGMNKIYVLTSRRTASASETLINGLRPYGVEVILIGETTRGKDEGSITVYDAPEADYSPNGEAERAKINPIHKRAMQPIVFKIFNSNMQDYPDGLFPDFEIRELSMVENLPPLGDPQDPLLSVALEHIKNGMLPAIKYKRVEFDRQPLMSNKELNDPFYDDMYLLPEDLPARHTIQ